MDTHSKLIKTLYESPSIKIHETRMRRVICASQTGKPEDYEFEDWEL